MFERSQDHLEIVGPAPDLGIREQGVCGKSEGLNSGESIHTVVLHDAGDLKTEQDPENSAPSV